MELPCPYTPSRLARVKPALRSPPWISTLTARDQAVQGRSPKCVAYPAVRGLPTGCRPRVLVMNRASLALRVDAGMRTYGRTSQVRALRTCFGHTQWRGTRRSTCHRRSHVDCTGEGSHADGKPCVQRVPRCLVVEATPPLLKRTGLASRWRRLLLTG